MSFILFIGLWLGAYRVSRLLIADVVLDPIREPLLKRYPPNLEYARLEKINVNGITAWKRNDVPKRRVSKLGKFLTCHWCLGFYVSGAVVGTVAQFTNVPLPLLWWFAVSTAVGLTARNLDA